MFTGNNTLDLREKGINMFLLPYQLDAIDYLYAVEAANSRQVWTHINRDGAPDPKSRASVINTLNALVDAELLVYVNRSGKGGFHRVYTPQPTLPTVEAFQRELVRRLLVKVSEDFDLALGYRWSDQVTIRMVRGEP